MTPSMLERHLAAVAQRTIFHLSLRRDSPESGMSRSVTLRTNTLCFLTVSLSNSRSQWLEGELKASSEHSSGISCIISKAKEPTTTATAQAQSGHAGARWATLIVIVKSWRASKSTIQTTITTTSTTNATTCTVVWWKTSISPSWPGSNCQQTKSWIWPRPRLPNHFPSMILTVSTICSSTTQTKTTASTTGHIDEHFL